MNPLRQTFLKQLGQVLLKIIVAMFLHAGNYMKLSVNYFFRKCEHIHSFLRICSHLLQKSLIENFFIVQCTAVAEAILIEKVNIKPY